MRIVPSRHDYWGIHVKAIFLGFIALTATAMGATMFDQALEGSQAQALYESMNVPVAGPYCTGLCVPGQPCDPTCTSVKRDHGTTCDRIEHLNTHQIEFRCTLPD